MEFEINYEIYPIVKFESREQLIYRHFAWKAFKLLHANKKLLNDFQILEIYKYLYGYFVCHFSRFDDVYANGEFLLEMFAKAEYKSEKHITKRKLKQFICKFEKNKNMLVVEKR